MCQSDIATTKLHYNAIANLVYDCPQPLSSLHIGMAIASQNTTANRLFFNCDNVPPLPLILMD